MESQIEIKKESDLNIVVSQINAIISQQRDEETEDDIIFKYMIKAIFKLGPDSNKIKEISKREAGNFLLCKLIGVLFRLLKYKKKEREELYETEVMKVKEKDIDIFGLIIDIDSNEEDIYIINEKMRNIHSFIYKWMKRNIYSLSQYLEIMFLSLFGNLNDNFDKYEIYSFIIRKYLHQTNMRLNFDECGIDTSNDTCLELILTLFAKSELDDEAIVLSLIILKFDLIKNYGISAILEGLKSTCEEINNRNVKNDIILKEIIITIFLEEIYNNENQKVKEKKNKKNKKNKKKKKKNKLIQDIKKKSEKIKISAQPKDIDKDKKDTINLDDLTANSENKIIINNEQDNNGLVQTQILEFINCDNFGVNNIEKYKSFIIKKINNVINLKDMERSEFSNEMNDLKNIMVSLLDSNYRLKEKLNKLDESIICLKEDMKLQREDMKRQKEDMEQQREDMEQQIESLREDVESLKYENEEIKDALSDIQCRGQIKNFLRGFKKLLKKEDYIAINEDEKKKGEIISRRVGTEFKQCKNKKNLRSIQNIIKIAYNSLLRGNDLAHSLTLEYFEKDIAEYKAKKKLNYLPSQEIFCFLVGIGIPDNDFDNAYDLLKKYFTEKLDFNEKDYYLENIFN